MSKDFDLVTPLGDIYEEFQLVDYKKGDKVICIKRPPCGHYQCEVGEVFTVKGLAGGIMYPTAPAKGKAYSEDWCAYANLFEKYPDYVTKEIYNSF